MLDETQLSIVDTPDFGDRDSRALRRALNSAAALAEAGADGLPPHYLRISILANKLAGLGDDLEIDGDLWETGGEE